MGSHALLCSCLPRAAMLGSRSKALLSSPLPLARVFLGALVTLSAPSHPSTELSVLAQVHEAGTAASEGMVANRLEVTVQAQHMWTGFICVRRGGSWCRNSCQHPLGQSTSLFMNCNLMSTMVVGETGQCMKEETP